MEAKIKIILNTASSRAEASKLLQKEKFRDEDIVRILQKYYRFGNFTHKPVIYYPIRLSDEAQEKIYNTSQHQKDSL